MTNSDQIFLSIALIFLFIKHYVSSIWFAQCSIYWANIGICLFKLPSSSQERSWTGSCNHCCAVKKTLEMSHLKESPIPTVPLLSLHKRRQQCWQQWQLTQQPALCRGTEESQPILSHSLCLVNTHLMIPHMPPLALLHFCLCHLVAPPWSLQKT